jgi:hypothetical protein
MTQAVPKLLLYVTGTGGLNICREGEAYVGYDSAPITILADVVGGKEITNIRLSTE